MAGLIPAGGTCYTRQFQTRLKGEKMKAAEVKLSGYYVAKVSNVLTVVQVREIASRPMFNGEREVTRYYVENVRTGRKTVFRSAAKFRREAGQQEVESARSSRRK